MSDKNTNEPQEREDYMKRSNETMDRPPERKEGIEEPKVKGLSKVQLGLIVFMAIVLIILVIGISSDMFGLMN